METLVIYDDTGFILSYRNGVPAPREPIGVPFLWVEIPEGKRIKTTDGIGVDVSVEPHQVILEDTPKTDIEILEERNNDLMLAIAELAMANEQDKIETQLAIAELATIVTGGFE